MFKYVVRRILLAIPLVLGISLLVFGLMHLAPGDPVRMLAGREAPQEIIDSIRREWGFDKPFIVQYFTWLGKVLRGDMGRSVISQLPVSYLIKARLPYTLKLNFWATLLGLAIAFPLGVVAAAKRQTWVDYAASAFALVGMSMPGFWLALVLIIVFAVQLSWFPTSGTGTWMHYVLPATTLGLSWAAGLMRMVRTSLLEVLKEDYVRTARAKGLREKIVLVKHALRNALIPIVTVLGTWLAYMVVGTVVVETIFAWPGLGRLLTTALMQRDFFLVQAIILMISIAVVAANLLVDVLYAAIDPRVRLS
ncbi:MAG TPA: ABC transporter permease [Firmicutes bacterium]|nr:ABC transporter permease [Bacillota bacterium]